MTETFSSNIRAAPLRTYVGDIIKPPFDGVWLRTHYVLNSQERSEVVTLGVTGSGQLGEWTAASALIAIEYPPKSCFWYTLMPATNEEFKLVVINTKEQRILRWESVNNRSSNILDTVIQGTESNSFIPVIDLPWDSHAHPGARISPFIERALYKEALLLQRRWKITFANRLNKQISWRTFQMAHIGILDVPLTRTLDIKLTREPARMNRHSSIRVCSPEERDSYLDLLEMEQCDFDQSLEEESFRNINFNQQGRKALPTSIQRKYGSEKCLCRVSMEECTQGLNIHSNKAAPQREDKATNTENILFVKKESKANVWNNGLQDSCNLF